MREAMLERERKVNAGSLARNPFSRVASTRRRIPANGSPYYPFALPCRRSEKMAEKQGCVRMTVRPVWERRAMAGSFCLAMTTRTHSLRYAGTAIAAVLTIASTSSLAQDAAALFPAAPEPVIVVPDVAPPTTSQTTVPQATVVVPTNQPPTVQPLPETSVETPEPQPEPVATATRTRAAAPAAEAATPAPRAVPAESVIAEETTSLPPEATAEPAVTEPVAPVAVTTPPVRPASSNDSGLLALILGGLLFLALAIWGFVAIGRRKGVRRYAAETPAATVPVAPAPVVAEPAKVTMREPVAIASRAETRPSNPSFVAPAPAASGALAHAGASIALPARVPESYAERDALMKRMIAARPDRANPFTDRGARTRRARLILQSLGRDFGGNEPWIDLSQYPNNWPELANKRSAAA
jgi:hypothetical protein